MSGTRDAVDLALARTVARAAYRVSLPLAPLYAFFALAHVLLLPREQARLMAPLAVATVLALLLLWRSARGLELRNPLAGHRYAAAVAGLVWLNSFVHLLVTREVHQITNFALLAVGVGALFLSTRWFVGALVGILASVFVSLAVARPSPLTVHFLFMVLSATALATVVFSIRRENAVRLELLRQESGQLSARLSAVLDAMGEGILVLDRDGRVTDSPSPEAVRIFGEAAREGADAVSLLYRDQPEGSVERQAFSTFLTLSFEAPDAWAEVEELAPRRLTLDDRPIALDFRHVLEGERVARLLLRARDESDKQALLRTLRDQEEAFARRLATMRRLAAGGGEALVSFLRSAEARCAACEALVDGDAAARTELFQHVHAIKGEADALELVEVRDVAHALEDRLASAAPDLELSRLRDSLDEARELLVRASPIGRAVLSRTTVDRADVERLEAMTGDRADELGALARKLAARPFGELVGLLAQRLATWAARLDKRVELSVSGVDVLVPTRLATVLPAVLAQLARNAVAHGVESSEERAAKGKPTIGTLTLDCTSEGADVRISVRDDGKGIDPSIDVFAVGVSTAEGVDVLAGRGVGLAAVAADLKRAGYHIRSVPVEPGACFEIAPHAVISDRI